MVTLLLPVSRGNGIHTPYPLAEWSVCRSSVPEQWFSNRFLSDPVWTFQSFTTKRKVKRKKMNSDMYTLFWKKKIYHRTKLTKSIELLFIHKTKLLGWWCFSFTSLSNRGMIVVRMHLIFSARLSLLPDLILVWVKAENPCLQHIATNGSNTFTKPTLTTDFSTFVWIQNSEPSIQCTNFVVVDSLKCFIHHGDQSSWWVSANQTFTV